VKIIVKTVFGSHLYGTSTPESDMDYKGVFLPPYRDVLLGKIPKSFSMHTKTEAGKKNSSDDIDTEIYSLHYFIHLACEGETVALDMLHTPESMLIESSTTWKEIVENRDRFYTKNLKAFIGYARRQASKYGIKGSRLNDAHRVLVFLEGNPQDERIKDIWDSLPEGEHIFKHPPNENNEKMYEVCGRKIGESVRIPHATDIVRRFYEAYGDRARRAAKNKGIDWKAVSHAFRAAFQVKEILTQGTITFPLIDAEFLRQVKLGKFDYQSCIAPKLDDLISEVEALSEASTLPMKADRKFWDDFIVRTVSDVVLA
jgi:hypothetical protein